MPHVAAHDLGAAAYAIRAVGASVPAEAADDARAGEREWQRGQLPAAVRELVLDDQRRRSALCWHVFDDGQPGSASWRAGMARSSPR